MKLQYILKRLAAVRAAVQRAAGYDQKNISDEIRGPQAEDMMVRNKRNFDKILRTDNDLLEADLSEQASAEVGGLNLFSKARNSSGNLITFSLIKDAVSTPAVNEIQLVEFDTVPDAGAWTLDFDGEVTSSLAFNANAAAIQSALNALPNLSGVTVSGDYTLGFTVTFAGADGGIDQPMLIDDSNTLETLLSPVAITVTEDLAGEPAVDTRSVSVVGSDVEVHSVSAATNTQVKAQIDASLASALLNVTIDAGQEAVSATAASNVELKGGA